MIMESVSLEEENIIKVIRTLFRLKKEIKEIKDRILRDIKNRFEHYYKPVWVSDFWSNNYIEYESNGCKNKTLSFEEYLI